MLSFWHPLKRWIALCLTVGRLCLFPWMFQPNLIKANMQPQPPFYVAGSGAEICFWFMKFPWALLSKPSYTCTIKCSSFYKSTPPTIMLYLESHHRFILCMHQEQAATQLEYCNWLSLTFCVPGWKKPEKPQPVMHIIGPRYIDREQMYK